MALPAFLGFVGKALLGGLASGLAGGIGSGGGQQAAPQNDFGVQSAMGGQAPPPLQENPTGGATFKDLVNQGIQTGISSLVGSKMASWQAGAAGRNSRKYLIRRFLS